MKTHKWSDIRRKTENNPASQARMERIRRAMDDVQAIAKLRDVDNDEKWSARHALQPVAEPRVSTIERAEDEYLETLAAYIADMGGRLEVAAVFPDERILLTRPTDAATEDEDAMQPETERTATYAAPTDD